MNCPINHGNYLIGPPRIPNNEMTVIASGRLIVKPNAIHAIKLDAYRNKGKKLNVVIVDITTQNLLNDTANSSALFSEI